ncbi:protein of unknown function [Taphrina deformans PYCC 5710]|uniref:Uncharacterized protein n=1 Tax=Taphrina deformans (strain PYCC 5710 / ATCC 11124 / CBS 356.35 / IMI 108563 / JCM 9778 / NBRC 8474) TaxID=1097556 RepID=R4X693_TAPDE|nr:protein of unknown function [Taphrina deformans PYCC 5710]|eukprot:CCG80509.1 protein of unknown function [Taphrina deformans PYCC 5710]
MRCLSRIKAASKYNFACTSGSPRPYSFASDIKSLLRSFEETPSVPPIIPVNKKTLSDFHRNVRDPRVSTRYLTGQYDLLHRTSSLRVLPKVIANGYLKRLLHDRDIGTTVKILLEYDLGEAVLVATNALRELDLYEREFCLFALQAGLLEVGQAGLMTQIMAELGYVDGRLDAFKRLTLVHDHMSRCTEDKLAEIQELCLILARRMRGSIDGAEAMATYSVLMLMRTSMALGATSFSNALCRQSWHAQDALKVYFRRLPEGQVVRILIDCARLDRDILDSASRNAPGVSVCVWAINRIKTINDLSLLCNLEPQSSRIRSTLAAKLAKHSSTLARAIDFATTDEPDNTAVLLFEWTKHVSDGPPRDGMIKADSVTALLSQASSAQLSEIIIQYLRLITAKGDGQSEGYDIDLLMNVLHILEGLPQQLSLLAQQRLARQFIDRPLSETLEYFQLAKTSATTIDGLLKHHLVNLRNYDRYANPRNPPDGPASANDTMLHHEHDPEPRVSEPTSISPVTISTTTASFAHFFSSALLILQRRISGNKSGFTQDQLAACFENVVRNLLQLASGFMATEVLKKTWLGGLQPHPELAQYIIRRLSRNTASSRHISQLLHLYPATVVTYEIYARYISRTASTAPATAMATLDLLLKKGLSVRRRLVQNLMSGISECTTISESRAFRYLGRVRAIAADAGQDLDRIKVASLLRVVLIRQGLGAATARINWLLGMSARLQRRARRTTPTPTRHEELVQILRKWHVHERTRGGGAGSLRPKRLREVLDAMTARRTVIGRKNSKRSEIVK